MLVCNQYGEEGGRKIIETLLEGQTLVLTFGACKGGEDLGSRLD